jgi:hypothetical protein
MAAEKDGAQGEFRSAHRLFLIKSLVVNTWFSFSISFPFQKTDPARG